MMECSGQARSQGFQKRGGGVLFGGKVDLKPEGGLIWGEKWTFVLDPMEPLAQAKANDDRRRIQKPNAESKFKMD